MEMATKSESSSKDTNQTEIELPEDESLLIARREADEVRTFQMYKSTWSVEAIYFVQENLSGGVEMVEWTMEWTN